VVPLVFQGRTWEFHSFMSESLRKRYRTFFMCVWWNVGAVILNIVFALVSAINHHWWSVPISLVAAGMMIWLLSTTCVQWKRSLDEQAYYEVQLIVGTILLRCYETPPPADIPEMKNVTPIIKRLSP
jgi:hypothetical protein